jgi:preprotein translocase subunit SecA
MSFWTWLTGKKSNITAADRIWLTKAARYRGLCRELAEHLASAQPSLLLAHFPATLTELQQELSRQGIPHRLVDHSLSAQEVNGWAGPLGFVHLGLARQLQPDPFPSQRAEGEGLIQIFVAERHFLRECDDVITSFAAGLGKPCHVTYHTSLEDPLMKVFAGDWVKKTLQHLGMDESAPIESPMVARQVRVAQEKFAAQSRRHYEANSAGEWLKFNGFAER